MNKTKHLFLTLLFALLTISVHAISFNYTANGRVWKCEGSSDGTASIIGIAEPASTCSGVLNFPGEVIDGNGLHRPVTDVGSISGGFNRYSLITDVNIPLSVKRITNGAFGRCTGLTTVSMPSSFSGNDGKNIKLHQHNLNSFVHCRYIWHSMSIPIMLKD